MRRKHLITLLLVVVFAVSLFAISAMAWSGTYANAYISDVEDYYDYANGLNCLGYKISVDNPGDRDFTLWFPDPYWYETTVYGHVRYTADAHGTGSVTEQLQGTYFDYYDYWYGSEYGYYVYDLPTGDTLANAGIVPNIGYKFDHFEITYANRDSNSAQFEVRQNAVFYPGDVMPFDYNLCQNFVKDSGYLEVTVCFAVDQEYLAQVKAAAKDLIDAAVGTDKSENVLAAAATAKDNIDAATTPEDVSAAKEAGLAAIAQAKADNAKVAAKQAIIDAVDGDTSPNVVAAAEKALAAIEAAKTVSQVNKAKDAGLAEIAAAKLANAKEAAKKAIDDAIAGETDPDVIKAAEDAKKAIDDAKTIDDVEKAKEEGLKDVEEAIKEAEKAAELAKAAEEAAKAALKDIQDAAKKAVSDEAKAIAAGAEARLAEAKTPDEVAKIKGDILGEMAAADKALQDAKDAAIAQLKAKAGSNPSDAMKAVLQDAINKVNSATSQSAVSVALSNGLTAITNQYNVENPPESEGNFFTRLFQKIGVIVEKILSIFKF